MDLSKKSFLFLFHFFFFFKIVMTKPTVRFHIIIYENIIILWKIWYRFFFFVCFILCTYNMRFEDFHHREHFQKGNCDFAISQLWTFLAIFSSHLATLTLFLTIASLQVTILTFFFFFYAQFRHQLGAVPGMWLTPGNKRALASG